MPIEHAWYLWMSYLWLYKRSVLQVDVLIGLTSKHCFKAHEKLYEMCSKCNGDWLSGIHGLEGVLNK